MGRNSPRCDACDRRDEFHFCNGRDHGKILYPHGEMLSIPMLSMFNGTLSRFKDMILAFGLLLCVVGLFFGSGLLFSFGVLLLCMWVGMVFVRIYDVGGMPSMDAFMFYDLITTLMQEIFVELFYLCWPKAETKPLIARGNLTAHGRSKYAQPVCEYLAIDVEAVNVANVKHGIPVHSLPTRLVQLPVDDISQVAVLSWRWDFEHDAFRDPSQNIAIAIQYARSNRIRFLFVDIVSLDQTLGADVLLPRVAQFGALYTTVPVIAAYDDPHLNFRNIAFRPWIFSEIKLMIRNPYKVVYVGHNRQGTNIHSSIFQYIFRRLPRSGINDTSFAKQLKAVWGSDFVTPALQILNGTVHMTNIHDFKFILPILAQILTAAERLDRNDYLLTVALMASASRYGSVPKQVVDVYIATLQFTNYKINSSVTNKEWKSSRREESGHGSCFIEHAETHTVCLGSEELASLEYHEDKWEERKIPQYTMTLAPDMERHVFEMLGLDSAAYSRYMMQEAERKAFLGDQRVVANPCIELVEVGKLHCPTVSYDII